MILYNNSGFIFFQNCRPLFNEKFNNYNLYKNLEHTLKELISRTSDRSRRIIYEDYLNKIIQYKRKSEQ